NGRRLTAGIAVCLTLTAWRRPFLKPRSRRAEEGVQIKPTQRSGGNAVDHVGKERPLFLEDFGDALFDRIGANICEYFDRLRLADSMDSIFGLDLDRRVPPSIEMNDAGRRGQVQSRPSGAERKNHNAA